EAFALLIHALLDHATASELVEVLALDRDVACRRQRREEDCARDDERALIFLALLLPERHVGKDALVAFEILLVADARRILFLRLWSIGSAARRRRWARFASGSLL